MKKISLFLILIFAFLTQCQDEKPNFNTKLTESSAPVEGRLPYFNSEMMDPYWPENGIYPSTLRKIPSLSLLSHAGKIVSDQSLLGRYKLIVFFYAKCNGICPMITRNMLNFYPKIKEDPEIQLISITINPLVDTSSELVKFRKLYRIQDENWIFLTGDQDSIFELARNQFGAEIKVINGKSSLTDFVHTENLYLIDKQNYLRGVYRAKGDGDLRRLLVELSTLKSEEQKNKEPGK